MERIGQSLPGIAHGKNSKSLEYDAIAIWFAGRWAFLQ